MTEVTIMKNNNNNIHTHIYIYTIIQKNTVHHVFGINDSILIICSIEDEYL